MIRASLRRFRADRGGNFVILFALLLVPMLGLVGLGIDYSTTLRAKTALDASADAAVLAAATEAMQIIESYSTPNYDATPLAEQYGYTAGQNVFSADSAMVQTLSTPTLNLVVNRDPNTLVITATGTYTVQAPTVFGRIFGTNYMTASGSAASSLTLPKYMNIYLVTDISQSMGIASTQADMNALSQLTGGCVFGCHVTQNGQKVSNEQVAHSASPPVTLRIDSVKQAFKNIISSAQGMVKGTPTIKIGIYTIQENIQNDGAHYYSTLSDLSYDYPTLQTVANNIDLGPNDSGGTGDTDFANAIPAFANAKTTAGGDGSGSGSPQGFVFLVTDGVSDVKGPCTDGHCTGPFTASLCDTFKNKNITVGVIYTTYLPFTNEQTYMDLVYPFQNAGAGYQVPTNLMKCASPGWYYEATDGPSIQNAINALFAQATASGRLTQ